MASRDIPRGDIQARERLIEYDSAEGRMAKVRAALPVGADESMLFMQDGPGYVDDVAGVFVAMLKELKKLNLYLSLITDTWLDSEDVE